MNLRARTFIGSQTRRDFDSLLEVGQRLRHSETMHRASLPFILRDATFAEADCLGFSSGPTRFSQASHSDRCLRLQAVAISSAQMDGDQGLQRPRVSVSDRAVADTALGKKQEEDAEQRAAVVEKLDRWSCKSE